MIGAILGSVVVVVVMIDVPWLHALVVRRLCLVLSTEPSSR